MKKILVFLMLISCATSQRRISDQRSLTNLNRAAQQLANVAPVMTNYLIVERFIGTNNGRLATNIETNFAIMSMTPNQQRDMWASLLDLIRVGLTNR